MPFYSVGAAVLSRGSHNPAGPVSIPFIWFIP